VWVSGRGRESESERRERERGGERKREKIFAMGRKEDETEEKFVWAKKRLHRFSSRSFEEENNFENRVKKLKNLFSFFLPSLSFCVYLQHIVMMSEKRSECTLPHSHTSQSVWIKQSFHRELRAIEDQFRWSDAFDKIRDNHLNFTKGCDNTQARHTHWHHRVKDIRIALSSDSEEIFVI
jgi:hypothetical protein